MNKDPKELWGECVPGRGNHSAKVLRQERAWPDGGMAKRQSEGRVDLGDHCWDRAVLWLRWEAVKDEQDHSGCRVEKRLKGAD